MPDHITSFEFERAMRGLRDDNAAVRRELAEGLAGVHERLDRVNGQLDTQRSQITTLDKDLVDRSARLKNIEREVFSRAQCESETPAPLSSLPPELTELVSVLKAARVMKAMFITLVGLIASMLATIWWVIQHVEFRP